MELNHITYGLHGRDEQIPDNCIDCCITSPPFTDCGITAQRGRLA